MSHSWFSIVLIGVMFPIGLPTGLSAAENTFRLEEATIADIREAVSAGALSSEKLVELYLARISAYDRAGPRLNSIISINPNAKVEAAAALDKERADKGPRDEKKVIGFAYAYEHASKMRKPSKLVPPLEGTLTCSPTSPSFSPLRAARTTAGYGADCVADNVDDSSWSGDAGRVIDGMRLCFRLHPLCHVVLCVRHDHSVVFGKEKPARNVPPKWAPDWISDAVQRYRPLHGGEHCAILRRCVLRERRLEGFLWQPNQPIVVRREFWREGVGLGSMPFCRS
jgi:hypothetical protein